MSPNPSAIAFVVNLPASGLTVNSSLKNDVRYFYDSDLLGENCIDYHQNKLGHIAQANIFKKPLK